jgi:hypothetical protein
MRGGHPTPGTVLLVECLKLRRSPALWVAVGTPVALSVLLCLGLMARTEIVDSPYWNWGYYCQMTRAMWGVFVFPALLATMAALSLGVEHRQDNWKSQLVQPVPVGFLYWAKFLVLVALVACSQIVLYGSTLLLGRALQLPGWPPAIELVTALAVIPASLPVLAFQFGLSLTWRSFVLPVGIGIFAHFISLVAASVPIAGFRPGYYSPFSGSCNCTSWRKGAVERRVLGRGAGPRCGATPLPVWPSRPRWPGSSECTWGNAPGSIPFASRSCASRLRSRTAITGTSGHSVGPSEMRASFSWERPVTGTAQRCA